MARTCGCCDHSERGVIEQQLIAGRSFRSVATDFGLRPAALHRHVQNHLADNLRASTIAHVAYQANATAGGEPNILQPVAISGTDDNEPTTDVPRRAFGLDDAAMASSIVSDQSIQSDVASSPEVSPAIPQAAAPLDPYSLACELRESAIRVLRTAEEQGDAKTALQANQTALAVLDRLSRLMPRSGEGVIAQRLHLAPEWERLRTTLLVALEPYPDARIAVVEALAHEDAL